MANYPFDIGYFQTIGEPNRYVASSDDTKVPCFTAQITALANCSKEVDIFGFGVSIPIMFFEMEFARTEYIEEVFEVKNGKQQIIEVQRATYFRHNFKTIMNDEEVKILQLFKHFNEAYFITNDFSVFPIYSIEVEPQTDSEKEEYQCIISFLIQNEELITDLCCDSPVVDTVPLNCDDPLFLLPPNVCSGSVLDISSTSNPDGTTTLSAGGVGDYTPTNIFWVNGDGQTVGAGSEYIATEPGTYCAYSSNGRCAISDCVTIADECLGTMSIESAGCNTIVRIVGATELGAYDGTIYDSNEVEVGTFTGTANGTHSFNLPYGDYTVVWEPFGDCDPVTLPVSIDECLQDCGETYEDYSISCYYEAGTFTPAPVGDIEALESSVIDFSSNGVDFDEYEGGGVSGGSFAAFKWTIKLEGCQERTLFTACGKECCPIVEFPDTFGINVLTIPPVTIENPCCDEDGGGSGGSPCPDPIPIEGSSLIVESTDDVFGSFGTYFSGANYLHMQTDGVTIVSGGGGTLINGANDCVWDSPASGTVCGRLNECGIWTDDDEATEVKFGFCFQLATARTISIGFGADNEGKFFLNGNELIHLENNGGIFETEQTYPFKRWWIVEVYIPAGSHTVHIEATDSGFGSETVGFEIYNATNAELMALTTKLEIDSLVIGSSRDIDNTSMVFGVAGGWTCPEGTTEGFEGCNPVCGCDDDYTPIPEGLTIGLSHVAEIWTAALVGCAGVETYKWQKQIEGVWTDVTATAAHDLSEPGLYRAIGYCDAVEVISDLVHSNGSWSL